MGGLDADVDCLCQKYRQAAEECAVVQLLIEEVEHMVARVMWTGEEASLMPAAGPGERVLGEGVG